MSAADGPLVVGVDSSTQSTKALVVDVATGRVVAHGQAPHTVTTGAGRESDPRQWWRRAGRGRCTSAARQRGEAAAVSVGGQQHGLVTLDARGGRCARPCCGTTCARRRRPRRLIEELGGAGAWAERAGSVPAAVLHGHQVGLAAPRTSRTPPRHRGRPPAARLPDRAPDRARAPPTAATPPARAGGRPRTEAYDEEILAARRGSTRALLPRVVPPRRGGRHGARHGGGLPFARAPWSRAGTGDNAAAALGLGLRARHPGAQPRHLGHGLRRLPAPPADPTGTVAGFADAARRLAAAGLHPQLHPRRRPDRRAAGPRPRGRGTRRRGRRCCRTWTANAPRTCRTPPACCTGCGTTRRPDSCCRPPTTAPSTRCSTRSTVVLDGGRRPLGARCC